MPQNKFITSLMKMDFLMITDCKIAQNYRNENKDNRKLLIALTLIVESSSVQSI